ncbi:MAG TPA: hypothetical protein VFQ54_04965, partial [Thermomicrobiales bacterium]|nr:hypothetical protein [Thermomicrobiales bacterium]
DFSLALSDDGQTYRTVLTGSLSIVATEQSFVLDKPVTARYARLTILSAQSSNSTTATIGEWKVIAQPGWSPPQIGGTPAASGIDIASTDVGGHVVATNPQLDLNIGTQGIVTADQQRQTINVVAGAPVSWVIGFNDNRAAQITSMTWQDPPGSDSTVRFDSVQVDVSTESPTGPWTSVGTWTLNRSNGSPTYAFDTPTWARFVQFTGVTPPDQATPAASSPTTLAWELPDDIAIDERGQDATYRSILGEWGAYSQDAVYERLVPPAAIQLDPDAGNDQASATLLPIGSRITNTAAVQTDEDWYRVDVPAGMGQLDFTLTGDPTLDVSAVLADASGKTIDMQENAASASETRYTATVSGGASYYLRVTQPPTSVVFAFDTSGSIGPYVSTVYQGLGQYAGEVQPGKEVVNFVPFGEKLLLDDWSGDPYLLQGAIAGYPRTAGSSDSEGSMLTAMDALSGRDGTKAIVLITDAESSPSQDEIDKLWPELGTVKPRIFTIQIAGNGGLQHSQDLMQDWASVNNGQYVYVRDQGEMDVAFERAAAALRRPTVYTVSVSASAPKPTPTPRPTNTPVPTATPSPT